MITVEDRNILHAKKKHVFLWLTIYRLGDVWERVCAGQVWCAATAGGRQVFVVHPLCVAAGHVPLLRQLWGDGEGGRGGRLGASLTRRSPQLVRCAVAACCRAAAHQRARRHTSACWFRVAANQRAGGDAASWRRMSGQWGAGLTQASLEGGAWWRVGGHCAVEGVGAAGDGVDAHDVHLGALRGGGSVRVRGGWAVWGAVWGTNPPPTDKKSNNGQFYFLWKSHLCDIVQTLFLDVKLKLFINCLSALNIYMNTLVIGVL